MCGCARTAPKNLITLFLCWRPITQTNLEMSRFWAGGSSSESENESQSDSDDEVQNQKNVGGKFAVIDSDSGKVFQKVILCI